MQHYGLPTRLLDWTESALVAAFFVVSNPKRNEEPGALWALLPSRLNKAEGLPKGLYSPTSREVSPLYRPPFQDVDDVVRVAGVLAPEKDIRMLVQLGTHTVHGSACRPVDEHPKADQFLRKWIVPAAAKPNLRTELAGFGIKSAALFPDLQHLADDLAALTFSVNQQESG
jgi:hypothetical protein